jgi:hypothetical protein
MISPDARLWERWQPRERLTALWHGGVSVLAATTALSLLLSTAAWVVRVEGQVCYR